MPCRFRPCIDLHGGKVKQIVGSTLTDDPDRPPVTNFEAAGSAAEFAALYRDAAVPGGHVIMLGPGNEAAAREALAAYPNGLQVGGGINAANARGWIDAGASHVIVTSYVFREGRLDHERLAELVAAVGTDRLVLDLSCRRRAAGGPFYVVTDRWQRFTELEVCEATLRRLGEHCAEFLVHAVDVEGKQSGIDEELIRALGAPISRVAAIVFTLTRRTRVPLTPGVWSPVPATYAGGIASVADLRTVDDVGAGRVHATVGSALSIFGGNLPLEEVLAWDQAQAARAAAQAPPA